AIDVAFDHPLLGAGLGMNALALNEARGRTWTSVHNVYLQYASDLGLIGLLLFASLLGVCLRAAKSARQDARVSLFAAAARPSLWAFPFAALFPPAGSHFYFFYAAGIAVAAKAASTDAS